MFLSRQRCSSLTAHLWRLRQPVRRCISSGRHNGSESYWWSCCQFDLLFWSLQTQQWHIFFSFYMLCVTPLSGLLNFPNILCAYTTLKTSALWIPLTTIISNNMADTQCNNIALFHPARSETFCTSLQLEWPMERDWSNRSGENSTLHLCGKILVSSLCHRAPGTIVRNVVQCGRRLMKRSR